MLDLTPQQVSYRQYRAKAKLRRLLKAESHNIQPNRNSTPPHWLSHVRILLLFVWEVVTHPVHFAGCTTNPDERWMQQIARNLTDCEDDFLNGKRGNPLELRSRGRDVMLVLAPARKRSRMSPLAREFAPRV